MRIIWKLAERDVAKPFVKAFGLKFMRVEPCAMAAASDCLLLCKLHKVRAHTFASRRVRHNEQLSEQPTVAGCAPHAAHDLSGGVLECDNQRAVLAWTGPAFVVLNEG